MEWEEKDLFEVEGESKNDGLFPRQFNEEEQSPYGVTYGELYEGLERTIKLFCGQNSEVTPEEAYSWIFHFDEVDSGIKDYRDRVQDWMEAPVQTLDGKETKTYKGNPIAYYRTNIKDRKTARFEIMFRDRFWDKLKKIQNAPFAILNGITYFGKRNTLANAHMMYALMIDLDGVTGDTLYTLFVQMKELEEAPAPNLITLSGTGTHLIYIFEKPIRLTDKTKDYLRYLKYCLLAILWTETTSLNKQRQYGSVVQSFRPIGGFSKLKNHRVRAFLCNSTEWTIEELEKFITPYDEAEIQKKMKKPPRIDEKTTTPLEIAKEKWPEWWDKVEEAEKSGKSREKGTWKNNPALYEWWKAKIQEKGAARCGHRYFCIFCLTIYAVKCGISKEQLREDALAIQPYFNSLGAPLNPFTISDVESALLAYDNPNAARFSIKTISALSGLPIEKKKHPYLNRYNEQMKTLAERAGKEYVPEKMTREKWLDVEAREMARKAQALYGTDWRKGGGRKSCEEQVKTWIISHPYARIADAAEELKLSRKTISKYWKQCGGLSPEERIDKWLIANPDASVHEAVDALKIHWTTFYEHKKKLEEGKNA